MEITVWNSPHSMPKEAHAAFSKAGAWDDDCDWVIFVPKDKYPPMFCDHSSVVKFNTSKGAFFAFYHS